MARAGRKPTGAKLVERLEGSSHAKERLQVILETLAGHWTIPDACQVLGIQESMFHKMRSQALQTALGGLEPRPAGRKPKFASPAEERAAELERQVEQLQIELKASEVRRELAEKLPRLSHAAIEPGKKTTLRAFRRGRPRRSRAKRSPR
jgi:hypothetical protein